MKLFRHVHRYKRETTVPLILKDDRTVMDIKKFQVTISFELDDEVNALIPKHRKYINTLINKEVIDHYAVSLESKKIWITISAEDKAAVDEYLSHSPLFKFWIYEVDEIYVLDGLTYRLPHLQLN